MAKAKSTRGKGSGWHREKVRHSRAKKYGIAGGRYATTKRIIGTLPRNIKIDENLFSFETKPNNKMSLRLGNLSTAGWYWTGNEKDLMGFVIRLTKSEVKEDFLKRLKGEGITFEQFKKELIKAVKTGDGLYEIAGDNKFWHFGDYETDTEGTMDWITDQLQEKLEEVGMKPNDKLINATEEYVGNNFSEFLKTGSYEDFEKQNKQDYINEMTTELKKAENWRDIINHIESVNGDWWLEAYDYMKTIEDNAYHDAYNKFLMDKEQAKEHPELKELQSRQKLLQAGQIKEQTKLRNGKIKWQRQKK